MSANRILLVCSHCASMDKALCLADRAECQATYEVAQLRRANARQVDEWFAKHAKCGNPDDFQLAYHRPQNWDVSPPAQDTVAGAVRLGIVNGSKQ